MTVNLFVLSTGFQYYFSTLLIEHLAEVEDGRARFAERMQNLGQIRNHPLTLAGGQNHD